ncbi:MAG: hypothetical protein RLY31_2070 [Bacteroidota bacterium]|jgi:hypothetical protein
MKIFNILLLLPLLVSIRSYGQAVTFVMPDLSADPGGNVQLDLLVENFQDITATQFSVNWDPQVLEFAGIDNFGLPDLSADGNFGLTETLDGKLRFSWFQPDLSGVTLDDMTALFSISFHVIGAINSTSPVMITNDPIVIEILDSEGEADYEIVNGTVTVQGPNSNNTTIQPQSFFLFQNSPNPFKDQSIITILAGDSMDGVLLIQDMFGKVIRETAVRLAPGATDFTLQRSDFGAAGSYFFTIISDQLTATRKLSVQ